MSKLAFTAAAAFLAMVASACADEHVYVLENWPDDIDHIPCSVWKKMPDGTWFLNATVKVGGIDLENVGVKGDAAARKVEKLCGARSK